MDGLGGVSVSVKCECGRQGGSVRCALLSAFLRRHFEGGVWHVRPLLFDSDKTGCLPYPLTNFGAKVDTLHIDYVVLLFFAILRGCIHVAVIIKVEG